MFSISHVSRQARSRRNKKLEKEKEFKLQKKEFESEEEEFESEEEEFELEGEEFESEEEEELEEESEEESEEEEFEIEENEIKKKKILKLVMNDISNKVFNPNKHRTQSLTRGLCTKDKIFYWNNLWISIDLHPDDRISSTEVKITTIRDLWIQNIIREAYKNDDFDFIMISLNFFNLIKDNIDSIISNPIIDSNPINDKKENKKWIAFSKWLDMENVKKSKKVRNYFRIKWRKIQNELKLQNIDKLPKSSRVVHYKSRSLSELKSKRFHPIVEPECIVNSNNQTLVHFDNLNNDNAFIKATNAITKYYFHTLNNPSHRSKGFWENFVEHFGAFVKNNLLPYTSSDMASTHNIEHLPCVHELIHALEPLSDSINQFINNNYFNMYEKLSNLSWGPFAPKPFRIFPMIAINFNTISDYHLDSYDEANSLCVLVALGDFEGGELCFPQLKIAIQLKPGQVVAFSSKLLLHGNCIVTKGIRYSIVYYIHRDFFKKSSKFKDVFDDLRNNIERDAKGKHIDSKEVKKQNLNNGSKNYKPKLRLKSTSKQTSIPPISTDKRRNQIDLSRTRRGLKIEDVLNEMEIDQE